MGFLARSSSTLLTMSLVSLKAFKLVLPKLWSAARLWSREPLQPYYLYRCSLAAWCWSALETHCTERGSLISSGFSPVRGYRAWPGMRQGCQPGRCLVPITSCGDEDKDDRGRRPMGEGGHGGTPDAESVVGGEFGKCSCRLLTSHPM